jgi:hypothetical protein
MTDSDNTIKIMKLSSGEEIISRLKEDHPREWKVESPLKLLTVPKLGRQGVEEQISLTRWIHFAEEKTVNVPKTQVLGMANATIGLSKFYEFCLKKIEGEVDLYEEPSDAELRAIEDEQWDEEFEEEMESYKWPSKVYH